MNQSEMSRCPYCGLKYCERIDHKDKRIAELEARLDAVQNCPAYETTGCDSSGETFAVVYLLKDNVLKALGGDDG